MFDGYALAVFQDEVDTLNEALKIAAMDIAEVAQAEDEDDEDILGEEQEDDVDDVVVDKSQRDGHDDGADAQISAARAQHSVVTSESKDHHHDAEHGGDDADEAAAFVDATEESRHHAKNRPSASVSASSASGSGSGTVNRDTLYRLVQMDSKSDRERRKGADGAGKSVTFVVHEDGSFDQRQ